VGAILDSNTHNNLKGSSMTYLAKLFPLFQREKNIFLKTFPITVPYVLFWWPSHLRDSLCLTWFAVFTFPYCQSHVLLWWPYVYPNANKIKIL
jgi:hypothetical protein